MKETKTWYEPHPVTPERKAELRSQGYRIVDAAFKPAKEGNQEGGAVNEKVAEAEVKRRGRKPSEEG